MRWAMGILAAVGLAVVGVAVAAAGGLIDVAGLDPFGRLNAGAARPATGPAVPPPSALRAGVAEAERPPAESEASLAALNHPGYQDRTIYLSAADATVAGPQLQLADLPDRGGDDDWRFRRARRGGLVDPKNRLPAGLIRGWATPEDAAEWTFDSPAAGRYAVTFDCVTGAGARGRGMAGGRFTVAVVAAPADEATPAAPAGSGGPDGGGGADGGGGGATLTADVAADASGGKYRPSAFRLIDVGAIVLPAGRVTLSVRPAERQASLLSLRSVRLYPATRTE